MSKRRQSTFYPTTLDEGLSAWIILFKDLLKRVMTAEEEAKQTLTALAFIRVYERNPPGDAEATARPKATGAGSLFQTPYDMLLQLIATLRQVRELLRDDLVTIELLLLADHAYEDLTTGAAFEQGVVLPAPARGDSATERFRRALMVLWTTGLEDLLSAARPVFETMARRDSTTRKQPEPGWIGIGEAVAVTVLPLVTAVDGSAEGGSAEELQKWLQFITNLQEQPYCQPERFAEPRPQGASGALEDRISELFQATVEDGRFNDLFPHGDSQYSHVQLLMEIGLSGKLPSQGDALPEIVQRWKPQAVETLSTLNLPEARCDEILANVMRVVGDGRVQISLTECVVALAQGCWEARRRRILVRIARLESGDVPDIEGSTLHVIHTDFFREAQVYEERLTTTMQVLRHTLHTIQQRATMLPPGFPKPPTMRRLQGEQIERGIIAVLDAMHGSAREVLGALLGPLPAVKLDISFDYTVQCHVSTFQASAGIRFQSPAGPESQASHRARVLSGVVVVPFVWLEAPRYLAALAHEIAHTYLTTAPLDPGQSGDGGDRSWQEFPLDLLTTYRDEIRELYEGSGLNLAYLDPGSVLIEALADLIALCVIGPHYLYALLFSTMGVAYVPPSEGEVLMLSENLVAVHPFVRFGALLRAAKTLWPWLAEEEVRERDEGHRRVGFWRPGRLRPTLSIYKAYFRMLEASSDPIAQHTVGVLKKETEIVGKALSVLAMDIRDAGEHPQASPLHVWPAEDPDLPLPDRWNPGPEAGLHRVDRRAFAASWAMSCKLWGTLKQIGAMSPGELESDWEQTRYLAYLPPGKPEMADFVRHNMVHLLWNSVLKRYPEATAALIAVLDVQEAGKTDAERAELRRRRRAIVEHALWRRTPELRLIQRLWTWAPGESLDKIIEERRHLRGRLDAVKRLEGSAVQSKVVTVRQLHCFWWGQQQAFGDEPPHIPDASATVFWAIGEYDVHVEKDRYVGPEEMNRAGESLLGWLPIKPRYTYVHEIDYVEIAPLEPTDGPTGGDEPVQAFLQMRIQRDRENRPIDERSLVRDMNERCGELGLRLASGLLRASEWGHLAFRVAFDDFTALSALCERLQSDYQVSYRTMSILYRGSARTGAWTSASAQAERSTRSDTGEDTSVRPIDVSCFPHARATSPSPVLVETVTRFRYGRARPAADIASSRISLGRMALVDVLRELWPHVLSRPLDVSLTPITGSDDLELQIRFLGERPAAPEERRKQTYEVLRVYAALLLAVARKANAFDYQTVVRLPGFFEIA